MRHSYKSLRRQGFPNNSAAGLMTIDKLLEWGLDDLNPGAWLQIIQAAKSVAKELSERLFRQTSKGVSRAARVELLRVKGKNER